MNIPTLLTLIRIAAIPVFVLAFYLPVSWGREAAAIIFILAAFTDWLDGYLARNLKQATKFGAFLDPVADKLMVAVALVLVIAQHIVPYLAIPAAIIIGREIVVSALREWMAEIGKRASVKVSYVAKIKTTVQMLALILLLLVNSDSSLLFRIIASGLLYVAAGLTLYTMVIYLLAAWPDLTLSME